MAWRLHNDFPFPARFVPDSSPDDSNPVVPAATKLLLGRYNPGIDQELPAITY